MTHIEEQKVIHAVFGLSQTLNGLLTLMKEMQLQRNDADSRILELLKLISRKH